MRTEDMLPIAEQMDEMGFWAMEVWEGGALSGAPQPLDDLPDPVCSMEILTFHEGGKGDIDFPCGGKRARSGKPGTSP